jgi:hypothetical protein
MTFLDMFWIPGHSRNGQVRRARTGGNRLSDYREQNVAVCPRPSIGGGAAMVDAPGAVLPLRFATREIPPSARRTALYELREQDLLPLAPLPDTAPEVDLQKWHLPGASVLSGTFAGIRQGGECRLGGDLFFGINVSGCSLLGQGNHEIAIGHGDAVFVDTGLGASACYAATMWSS